MSHNGCDPNTENQKCTRNFTVIIPHQLTNSEITLTATAADSAAVSNPFSKTIIIPRESILGCKHIDLGSGKNEYNLKFVYAWEESPNIDLVVNGELVAALSE